MSGRAEDASPRGGPDEPVSAPQDPRTAARPPRPAASVQPPSLDALLALDADRWAGLLPHVRAALHRLEGGAVTPVVTRLRAAPASRLAAGRTRRELAALLAAGGPAWDAVQASIGALDPVPDELAWVVDPARPLAAAPPTRPGAGGHRAVVAPEAGDQAKDELRRARERARALRHERDQALRRAEGEQARAAALERERDAARHELDELREELATTARQLAEFERERTRALERERRRREGEVARLEQELAALRRTVAEQGAAGQVAATSAAGSGGPGGHGGDRRPGAAPRAGRAAGRPAPDEPDRLVPGRPSRLPAGVASGTTEAAQLLLHAGRLVLVDGYNVTLQHRPQLDLEAQRTWLVQLLAALAARRRIRPVVVFDGEVASGGRPPAGARGVRVRFTPAHISADDEIVLALEGTDEPVAVVTDDRELAARAAASGADVVGTRSFLGAAS